MKARNIHPGMVVVENGEKWRVEEVYEIPSGLMGGRLAMTLRRLGDQKLWRFHVRKNDTFTVDLEATV